MAGKSDDPIERLRLKCLARGSSGIKGLGRVFRIMDDDRSRTLNKEEFTKGVHNYGLDLKDEEIAEAWNAFDKDGSGSITFDEFIESLRGPMSQVRKDITNKAFETADKSGDGVINANDLKRVYNAKKHPKFLNGEMTEKEVFDEFLKSYEPDPTSRDGQVTKEEFMSYYAGISASIDNDAYFSLMIRNAWNI